MKPSAGRTCGRLVVGVSLKMYFGYAETLDWCARVSTIAAANEAVRTGEVRLFVMPSAPFLLPVLQIFRGTAVDVGAQNIHYEDRGPFTGEVSGSMLSELGCSLVEVGHSERRRLFGESEDLVALKVEAAVRNGLCPVICVGEEEKMDAPGAGRESIRQLESALARASSSGAKADVVVAYEPEWAIGADQPAPDVHIADVCRALRDFLRDARHGAGDRVIYGGSAGPGLLERLGDAVDGLFLGRYVHDAGALDVLLQEAGRMSHRTV